MTRHPRLLALVLGLLIGVAVATMTGCTPAQTSFWLRWHHDDPEAAVSFLDTPEGQATLADTGTDGPQFAEWLENEQIQPGNCESYWPLMARYGLPRVFLSIARRESGCDHRSFVMDGDDLGGGLLGLNLRAGADRWREWCGLTVGNVIRAETNIACAAAAYARLGMAPWR